jgi:nucleoside-diphosphate-sugar epimerase
MVDVLARAGHDIVGLDTYLFEDCGFGADGLRVPAIRADIRDLDAADLSGFDAVIHLAAVPNDQPGTLDPQVTYDINHLASVRLARVAREAGVKRFLFASSCSVYGAAADDALLAEDAAVNPVTAYAESKALCEQDVSRLATNRFSPVFLRNATAYGVSPRLRLDVMVNQLVGHAFTTGRIGIQGNGTAWRPLVHVEDISRAFLAALEAPRDLVHNRAFNVGQTGENYQIREIADMVLDTVPGSRVTYAPHANPDPRRYRVNCDEIAWTVPAFRPQWTLRDGVRELYEAYRREGLTYERVAGDDSQYLRTRHLLRLKRNGLVDDGLRWTAERGTPPPVHHDHVVAIPR